MKEYIRIDRFLERKLSEASFLPSKEALYRLYFEKVEDISEYKYSKFYSEDYYKLLNWELQNLRDLIHDYPSQNIDNVKTKKDLTLEVIEPDVLYKVYQVDPNRKNKHFFGVVYVEKDRSEMTLFYSSRECEYIRSVLAKDDKVGDRLDIKKRIKDLIIKE